MSLDEQQKRLNERFKRRTRGQSFRVMIESETKRKQSWAIAKQK